MKIVLADCYHDSDKGGGGMVAGAVAAIREGCGARGERGEISLLYRFSEDDPKFAGAARLTAPAFPDCPVHPAPISSRRGPGLAWLSWGLRVVVLGTLRLVAPGWSRHPGVVAMRQADLILFKGGNFYRSWSRNAAADLIAMILLLYPAILAARMGKPYAFVSHTFGPFHTAVSRRIVRRVLSGAVYVSTRESRSSTILRQCGVPASRVKVTPDFGFGASPASDERAHELLRCHALNSRDFVAFTARPWFYADRRTGQTQAFDAYLAGAAALLDHALESGVSRAALVVQNDGAHSVNEPDLPVLESVRARMRHKDRAVIIDHDYPYDDLCAIYGQARLTIGTRLHSCIFSFVAGTPPIAIAYSHKAPGIMQMMGLAEYALDIAALSIEDGKRLIQSVFEDEEELRRQLAQRAPALREALLDAVADAMQQPGVEPGEESRDGVS